MKKSFFCLIITIVVIGTVRPTAKGQTAKVTAPLNGCNGYTLKSVSSNQDTVDVTFKYLREEPIDTSIIKKCTRAGFDWIFEMTPTFPVEVGWSRDSAGISFRRHWEEAELSANTSAKILSYSVASNKKEITVKCQFNQKQYLLLKQENAVPDDKKVKKFFMMALYLHN